MNHRTFLTTVFTKNVSFASKTILASKTMPLGAGCVGRCFCFRLHLFLCATASGRPRYVSHGSTCTCEGAGGGAGWRGVAWGGCERFWGGPKVARAWHRPGGGWGVVPGGGTGVFPRATQKFKTCDVQVAFHLLSVLCAHVCVCLRACWPWWNSPCRNPRESPHQV